MKTITTMLSAGALAAGLAACSAPQTQAPTQTGVTPQSVSSDQLQRFANAARKVNAVSGGATASGGTAATGTTSTTQGGQPTNATFDEANGRKAQAIWSEGLTVQEFNAINAAVQQDPALRERYGTLMRGSSGSGAMGGGSTGGSSMGGGSMGGGSMGGGSMGGGSTGGGTMMR
ncbi:MAG: DUF4168 domain-containing protein [Pigmentiphaga sp.]|uniref:DUF4168 domain-containing protein n=1 Tax=Pigmentiphaga sp. TaxID=1977564 RepID=UPI0029A4A620|nr:DUF4168 domain-containing protein [Pigmentiphaga sp.]MDX3904853.1 DUF4168 domain-containing protein [Pigmentiphaga sp.]